jgi:hypothetical protein
MLRRIGSDRLQIIHASALIMALLAGDEQGGEPDR